MAALSNVYMNWKSVTVSYGVGPTVINVTEVLDVEIIDQEQLEMWQADGHIFPTLCIRAAAARGLKIIGGSVNKLAVIPRGTPCTVVAVLYDAVNGAGSGAMTHTLTGAVVAEVPRSGQSNKYAGVSISFVSASADGTGDPLTTTIAA